jgi:cytochrome c oxidase subunit IV
MDDKHAHDIRSHLKVYIGVFVALLVGTVITVAASRVDLGHAGNISLAMVIAVAKAFLVAGFFMHLVSEKKPIYTILIFTGFFFVVLMALTIWSMYDSPDMTVSTQHAPPAHAAPGHHVP